MAKDGVDPNKVPKRKVYTGAEIPAVGLGTYGSDRFSAEQIAEAVKGAIAVGYRHIDCAAVYGNEHLIGESLQAAIQAGVKREELWITSKVWNDMHGDGDVLISCAKSLKDLQLDYLDLFLVHWPFPNYHAPGVSVDSRDPHARPYIHEEYMKVWRQMERLVELGLVKHIGTSNMTIPKLKLVLRDAKIKPACNEMELHPHFQQPELFKFVVDNGIVPIGFCPIGSPKRPDRDKTEADTVDIEDPVIVRIAQRHQVHPAVICVKWAVQRGQVPIPFSIHRDEYLSNLMCSVIDPLTDEEMKEIATIDQNCRLIKGQVFLWESAKGWEDLWDLNGEIASW
ncbi:MAG TPA: aldo/keto reductase [Firmicutes bacterium]|nr:aldo/keto reductase [Bacillota bacterium]